MLRIFGIVIVSVACLAQLAGCVAYAPAPAYYPAPAPAPALTPNQEFDRAWNAALDALAYAGVRITFADRASGVIRGTNDRSEVRVSVARQFSGTLQVEIEASGPEGRDPGLARRVSEDYRRRMGH
jgi:hypothetical protein